MNKKFWKNKNILITGIYGFVGSNLCKRLLKLEANIYGLYKNNSSSSLLKIENIEGYNTIQYKSSDYIKLQDLITDKEIEICFHLASQVEVQKAFEEPYNTMANNIELTLSLLEGFRKSKSIKSIIITSTDKVYGDYDEKNLPYKETLLPKPVYPYEVSKYICEKISSCYYDNYELPIVITRTSNIFGPGQLNLSALIPSIVMDVLNIQEFFPRSNGLLKRDYFYINDWIDSLIDLSEINASRKIDSNIYNFGNGVPLSAIDITNEIFNVIKNKNKYKKIINKFKISLSDSNEIKNQYIDSNKAKKELNINYHTKIGVSLKKTIDWYSKYF